MSTATHYRADREFDGRAFPQIWNGLLSSAAVCQEAGITYRQLDHWIRVGTIDLPHLRDVGSGTGGRRRFAEDEAKRIVAVAAEKRYLDERCAEWSNGTYWHDITTTQVHKEAG